MSSGETIQSMGSALAYARAYAALGWPVLPIRPKSKAPLASCVPRGFLDATTDREVIDRWWTAHPEAGIGVAVGRAGMVAVDIDPRNGGDIAALPFDTSRTLHAQTGGGGEHILYRVPEGYEPIATQWKGIDLKWSGYIVVEPSVHPTSGRPYGFVDWDVLTGEIPEIEFAPLALVQRLGTVAEVANYGSQKLSPQQRVDLEATLATIPADEYDTWISIGHALASLAEGGFELWDEWAQKSTKYDGSDSRRRWASFAKTRMHWKWVLKHAEALGGRNVHVASETRHDPPAPSDGDSSPRARRAGGKGAGAEQSGPKGRKRDADPEKVDDLRRNFVLIYGTDTVYDLRRRMIVKVNALRLAYGSDEVRMWLKSDRSRRMIVPEQLVFDPTRQCSAECINLFSGLAIEPADSSECGPILELIEHLCSESAKTAEEVVAVVNWVLDWLAYPLQNLGAKMATALVFHGPQGAGKNLFFEAVASIYGRYALVVGQDQLEDKFNDWASQRLFLIGDEVVARVELYHQKNKLKSFITGETIQINAKMLPLRTERNHVNVVFLSNEQQPLALEQDDRRYMVVYTPPRREDDLYARVHEFLQSGGAARFLQYLLSRDLSGFSRHARPPMTRAKKDLIELGLKPPERFAREWLKGYLPLPLQPCSSEQLYRAFRHWCQAAGERFPPPQVTFSKALEKVVRGTMRAGVIKLDHEERGKVATRMWVPDGCGPPEGMTAGQWASDSVIEFERVLRVFCRGPGEDE